MRPTDIALPGALAAPLARLAPGAGVSAIVAIAAAFLAQHYGAPVMMLALIVGMALAFLGDDARCAPGIDFVAKQVLRLGVALLGLRVTAGQVFDLGWGTMGAIVLGVVLTIAFGIVLARLLGFSVHFGVLAGGAVAICGASAALALAAALPAHPQKERAAAFTVIGVSLLSTIAMVLYPLLVHWFGFDAHQAGVFLGGTIHDVAQVVGAGYSVSQDAGDTATVVKLLRVALLAPVILFATTLARRHIGAQAGGKRPPLLPWFAVGFFLLVALRSLDVVPKPLVTGGQDLSQACLIASMAAIGLKTRLKAMASVGWQPIAHMVVVTAWLAALCAGAIYAGLI